jgi:uncharacterized membrane protein
VIEHLQGHSLGLIHLLMAFAAIGFGTAVMSGQKGTVKHRWNGRCFFALMLGLNVTALLNYELYGVFGPFHWMALASLLTIIPGYFAAWRRSPGSITRHAIFMSGAYAGLMAAATAELPSPACPVFHSQPR